MAERFIIDNGSIHLPELIKLVKPKQVVKPQDPLEFPDGSIIFLSGSPTKSVIGNEDYYKAELDFISSTKLTVIGICLGCELIAVSLGGTLHKLLRREHGSLEIAPTEEGSRWLGKYYFWATEAHRWAITSLPPEIKVLATSKDGIEAFVHNNLVGLQFHPEATLGGDKILRRILRQLSSPPTEKVVQKIVDTTLKT